jgi:hypothetical protein
MEKRKMERMENDLLLEAIEGRLEFGFWAWLWSELKQLWQNVWVGGGRIGVDF